MATITTKSIRAMPAGSWLWDDDVRGLGLRYQRRDHYWSVRWRDPEGKSKQAGLGCLEKGVTLELARRAAKVMLGRVASGEDPSAKAAEPAKPLTLGDLVEPYLTYAGAYLRPKSLRETTRHLRKNWAPLHAVWPTKDQVNDRLTEIAATKRTDAVRARAALSSLVTWAQDKHRGLESPIPNLKNRKDLKLVERNHTLEPHELRRLWLATDDSQLGRIVRLLILTGCRRTEIGDLRWSEIVGHELRLPKERVKNDTEHRLPLTPLALAQLPPRGPTEFVFDCNGHGYTCWGRLGPALFRAAGIENARLHDIRRSVASIMGDQDIAAPHIIEEILNHKSGHKAGVAGIYQRSKYEKQVKAAMTKWSAWVKALVTEPTATQTRAEEEAVPSNSSPNANDMGMVLAN